MVGARSDGMTNGPVCRESLSCTMRPRMQPIQIPESSAATELRAADADPFVFIGDVLALDLVNTEVVVRGKGRDLLATPADVEQWGHAAQRYYPDMEVVEGGGVVGFDLAALAALKKLRGALRGLFGALADGTPPASTDIDVVNSVLRTGAHALMLTSSGAIRPIYQAQAGTDPMHFAIALSALRLMRDGERQRLHRCSNERCVLLFYDTTKSATRRWCSLGCMDRARSAKRYRAAKERSHS